MKYIAILCIFLTTGIIGYANAETPTTEAKPALETFAKLAFKDELSVSERGKALETANERYQRVRVEVLRRLAAEPRNSTTKKSYMSSLHCAIIMAASWNIPDAENHLIEIVAVQLDPETLPLGMTVPTSYLFPAADALAKLRPKSSTCLEAISTHADSNIPFFLWVFVETQGKDNAETLLKYHIAKKTYNVSRLRTALHLLESTDSIEDLLPNPFSKKQ